MVEVLAFLYEGFVNKYIDFKVDFKQLAKELPRAGFEVDDINIAMEWLNQTIESSDFTNESLKKSVSARIFSPLEMAKLDEEARGLIYFLGSNKLITPPVRELIIERAMALQTNIVGKNEMRLVLLFVMMNTHARQDIIEWIEASIVKTMAMLKPSKTKQPEKAIL